MEKLVSHKFEKGTTAKAVPKGRVETQLPDPFPGTHL